MDRGKTGALIASARRAQGLTQQALAGRVHVTAKAVSKWERGRSFPGVDVLPALAAALGLPVEALLSGKAPPSPTAEPPSTAAREGGLHAVPEGPASPAERGPARPAAPARNKKRRARLAAALVALSLAAGGVLWRYGGAIFQRGNPIPYLLAAAQLDSDTPFAEVGSGDGVYIAPRGECPALLEFVERTRHVTFVEQAGSGYLFSNGVDGLVVQSEVYWGRFTVYQVPMHTLQAP